MAPPADRVGAAEVAVGGVLDDADDVFALVVADLLILLVSLEEGHGAVGFLECLRSAEDLTFFFLLEILFVLHFAIDDFRSKRH